MAPKTTFMTIVPAARKHARLPRVIRQQPVDYRTAGICQSAVVMIVPIAPW
jgi:hypothetical protein